MTATPEQDRPDRLAEIKQRAAADVRRGRHEQAAWTLPWVANSLSDRVWLIAEVERLRTAVATYSRSVLTVNGEPWMTPGEAVESGGE